MNRPYYTYQYNPREERFIGPILPFVGGALIGYIAGRPQYNYSYPTYYPYPVYYYPTYYQTPYPGTYTTSN